MRLPLPLFFAFFGGRTETSEGTEEPQTASMIDLLPTTEEQQPGSESRLFLHKKRRIQVMDALDTVFDPLRDFAKDSVRLVKRCHKPDRKEFSKVAVRTAIGFVVMGFVGFFVKLIFIPINNIIVGSA
nr:protein transport protein SEC61 subunit gamma [Ipomoea batatas]